MNPERLRTGVPLAQRTTLELGGPAAYLYEAETPAEVAESLDWAEAQGLPTTVLGGGSNVVVSDEGFEGLVLTLSDAGADIDPHSGQISASAGMSWDALVAQAVSAELQGFECLSGIPGRVGAVPIQNVGAYGQEIAETVLRVDTYDRQASRFCSLQPHECAFGYRDSVFKRDWERYVVLRVHFQLRPGVTPALGYAELERCFAQRAKPTLADVRSEVLRLRRNKSMVHDPEDPNHRSAGSFFINPVVSEEQAQAVVSRFCDLGGAPEAVPRYPQEDGRVKLPAGWLIEQSGFAKGMTRLHVGLSTRHALALVHLGGGSTQELLGFAREIRQGVRHAFGIALTMEPRLLGFQGSDPLV
ncbi:MAG: UDP-N-acetylmuramate dehydrogenase [Myxococcota bacterium]